MVLGVVEGSFVNAVCPQLYCLLQNPEVYLTPKSQSFGLITTSISAEFFYRIIMHSPKDHSFLPLSQAQTHLPTLWHILHNTLRKQFLSFTRSYK